MPSTSILHDIPGGKLLLEWFGHVPRFHDAELLEISFSSSGTGLLRIHGWNMTDKVDAKGYYVLEKHAIVTLNLEGVSEINCTDFDVMQGIISDLAITKVDEQFRIEWEASYGVTGFVIARHMRINLEPGKPD